MNNPQQIALLIRQTAKENDTTIKQLLEKCELNINTISELSKGKQISYLNFAKIADFLGVSVDYLLGRTDNPETQISGSNINGDNSIQNINSNNTADTTNMEMLDEFQKLTFSEKAKVMCLIAEFNEKRNL